MVSEDTWVNFITAFTALIWSAWQELRIRKMNKKVK